MEDAFQQDQLRPDDEGHCSSLFNLAELKDRGGFKAADLLAVDPELENKFMAHIEKIVKHDMTEFWLI